MVDLTAMRQVVLAAETLSFRQAAALLGVRPSAVSRRVRTLEDSLGVSLFERTSSGIAPTAAGRRFVERARIVLAEVDYAVKSAGDAGRGAEGFLRIGVFSSLASMFLHELIAVFLKIGGRTEIDVAEGSPRVHLASVRERLLDVAFVTGKPVFEDLDVFHAWSERVFVALPTTHALALQHGLSWAAIRTEHFVLSRQEPGPEIHDYLIRRLADLGYRPSVCRYEVARENLMNLVGLGFGISLISEAAVAVRYPGVVFRPIEDEADLLPFSAVWSPRNDNPSLRRFLSQMRTLAADRGLEAVR